MMAEQFEKMDQFHRRHYLGDIRSRNIENEKRHRLGTFRFANYPEKHQIQVRLAGFDIHQRINIDCHHFEIVTDEALWLCGPSADIDIPIQMIEEILVNGKGVYSRG